MNQLSINMLHKYNQTFCFCIFLLAAFKAKYTEKRLLGEGGFGSVFAGYRTADNLPVSLTHLIQHTHTCPLFV